MPLTSFADALAAYERKQKDDPQSVELTLGRMRCLHALGEWERLAQLSLETWKAANGMDQRAVRPWSAAREAHFASN